MHLVAGGADHEVAALQAGLGGRAAALHAQDQHAVAIREADRAAHPLGHGRRRDRDAEPRRDAVVRLEEAQPPAQALGERRALVLGQAGREAGRRVRVGGAGGLDAVAAPLVVGDDRPAAVVGIALALDVPGALQAREAHAQRAARALDAGHEVALGEALLRRVAERLEHEVARAGEPVLGERLLELRLEVRGGADEVVDEGDGRTFLGHTSCSKVLRSSDSLEA